MDRPASQAQKTSLTLSKTRQLTELKSGETAVIQNLFGGVAFRSRLAALGFTPGAKIKVLQNRGHGSMIVSLRDTRIALGRGEARKILVTPQWGKQ